ncbi:SHOCT domain-containing protein [Halovivax gelatinilyticus]|uniref:SHOCT domain-containing protein n=1 Tax=Halovivax gelatinilyticus TaxID=2961597 RepID=UPI0020CA4B16|nr:SHOCT domain-containing protein [Halovivax gelatinilyticus]
MGTRATNLLGGLVAITAVATLPLGILAFVFSGWQLGLAVFVVGWLLLVPTFAILAGVLEESTSETDRQPAEREDPLETLRERYASGEIDETEFERRVDELLETDPTESASKIDERTTDRELERE